MFVIALLKHETWQSNLNKLVLFGNKLLWCRLKLINDTLDSSYKLSSIQYPLSTYRSWIHYNNHHPKKCLFCHYSHSCAAEVFGGQRMKKWTDGRSKSRKDGQSIVCSSILMILQSSGKSFSGLVTTSLGKAWSKATIAI